MKKKNLPRPAPTFGLLKQPQLTAFCDFFTALESRKEGHLVPSVLFPSGAVPSLSSRVSEAFPCPGVLANLPRLFLVVTLCFVCVCPSGRGWLWCSCQRSNPRAFALTLGPLPGPARMLRSSACRYTVDCRRACACGPLASVGHFKSHFLS